MEFTLSWIKIKAKNVRIFKLKHTNKQKLVDN